jgi:hypothetical protein
MDTNFMIKRSENFDLRLSEILLKEGGKDYPHDLFNDILANKDNFVENPTDLKNAIDIWFRNHLPREQKPKSFREKKNAPRTDAKFYL